LEKDPVTTQDEQQFMDEPSLFDQDSVHGSLDEQDTPNDLVEDVLDTDSHIESHLDQESEIPGTPEIQVKPEDDFDMVDPNLVLVEAQNYNLEMTEALKILSPTAQDGEQVDAQFMASHDASAQHQEEAFDADAEISATPSSTIL
jgi:hypothetical protein